MRFQTVEFQQRHFEWLFFQKSIKSKDDNDTAAEIRQWYTIFHKVLVPTWIMAPLLPRSPNLESSLFCVSECPIKIFPWKTIKKFSTNFVANSRISTKSNSLFYLHFCAYSSSRRESTSDKRWPYVVEFLHVLIYPIQKPQVSWSYCEFASW